MAVRFRDNRGKWEAQVHTPAGRKSRLFDDHDAAVAWEAIARAEARAEAERLAARARAAHCEEVRPGTLAEVLQACCALDWAGKDASQAENATRLVRQLGPRRRPSEVNAAAIDRLVSQLREQGRCNATINRYLSALRVLLLRAQRLGLVDQLPLFPERRQLREAEPRELVLPDEWLAALLDVMERREQRVSGAVVRFLRRMGCRVGEALSLEWDRVDLARNRITFVQTKGNRPRTLPIPREVLPILSAMRARAEQPAGLVFPVRYATLLLHYRDARDEVCDRLGLGESVRREWVIHTLRHTQLTELAQRGWSAPAIAQWAGHQSLSVTQRYVHGSAINLEALMEC